MPVTVRLTGRADKTVLASGEAVAVDDAVLVVTAREGRAERVVAVYAEGAWVSAEVNDTA